MKGEQVCRCFSSWTRLGGGVEELVAGCEEGHVQTTEGSQSPSHYPRFQTSLYCLESNSTDQNAAVRSSWWMQVRPQCCVSLTWSHLGRSQREDGVKLQAVAS